MAKVLLLLISFGLLLTACQPGDIPALPASTLPPPRVEHSRVPVATAAPELPDPAATEPVAFPQDLPQLARALHGDRLPEWLAIPSLNLQAPVIPVGWVAREEVDLADLRWDSPEASVGWVIDSGVPGAGSGNVLLYGHNNMHSSVFRDLYLLQPGDLVVISSASGDWRYTVDSVEVLPVESNPVDSLVYAAALKDSLAPRLTIIACWPPNGNSHRVLVTAFPSP